MHLATVKKHIRAAIERCNIVEASKVSAALNILSARCEEETIESLLAGLSIDAMSRRIDLEDEEAQS